MSRKSAFFDIELRRELRKIFLKTLALRLASGLVSFLAVASWVFLLVVVWTAASGAPPLWQTLAVSRGAAGIFALLALLFVVYPLLRVPRVGKLALAVESRKDFDDIVAAGYEFSNRRDLSSGYSPALVREVIRRAVRSVTGLQVRFLFLSRRQLALVPVAYAALIALIVTALSSPAVLIKAGRRIAAPREAAAVVHDANLYASPGDVTVLSGADVEVTALDFGGSEQPVMLSYNLSGGFWKTEPAAERETLNENNVAMKQFAYTFKNIRNSLTYYFQAGDNKSPEYRITVVNKPIVTELAVVLTPPSYTGEAPDTLVDSGGNVQALEGTHVRVDARANNVLEAAQVQFDDEDTRPVDVAGRTFGFDFTALRDGSYSVLLEDERGHATDEPLVYAIEVYSDNPPGLDVLEPGSDATLPRNLEMKVSFICSDDYGVQKADIYHRKGGNGPFQRQRVALGADKGKRDIAAALTWALGDVTLFPGDFIEYFLQVEDNNVVTGPGVTKSRMFRITVPTMAELYEKIEEEDGNRSDLFQEALKESKDLKERVEKLSREFKKTEKLDWTQQKEIDKTMASQEKIQEKLEDIQQSLDETLESLSDNKMTSQEIGEKLEEINRLMEEINDQSLNKYMDELRKAMEKLDAKDIQEALENLELSAEDLLKSLERTEALLKEIQKEQEMEELVRKSKDLMDAQEELNDKTSETDAGDREDMQNLAEEQEALSKDAKELEGDLEDFAGELSEELDDPEMSEQMQETADEFSERDPSQKMQDASDQLQGQQKQNAAQNQQEAMSDLIALFTRVVEMQAGMQNSSQQRSSENLQRLARSTLDISFKQENLTERLREQASTSDAAGIRALAEEQLTYVKAISQVADELDEISKKTLNVPQSLLKMLGGTINRMQSSMVFLEQNKAFMSTTSASQAITSLNQITIALLSAARQCSSGGGSGSPQPMSAMQQLLQGQKQMLQDSKAMAAMRAAQEKLLQERQAAMQRLAGEQRSLRQMAENIQKDGKQGDRPLGRMDKIIEEMQEVIRDLEGGVLDEQTLRNQERILSRMLDAQRSVHSRDYEKKRLSTAAGDLFSSVPDGADSRRASQMLREEIRRAMALKAPGEFEELIRLYFRALAEEAPVDRGGE
ncbi:MAG: DUF4175 family protein [Candidatus Krumholzibacteriia bacterium]